MRLVTILLIVLKFEVDCTYLHGGEASTILAWKWNEKKE